MPANEDKDDDIIKFLLTALVMVLFITLMWLYFKTQITSGIRWIRVAEIYVIRIFSSHLNIVQEQLIGMQPDMIDWAHIMESTRMVTNFIKVPVCIILVLMGLSVIFFDPSNKYRRRLDLEAMIKEHAKGFPVTTPITKFNPLEDNYRKLGAAVPSELPMFAEALSPEEWVAYNAVPMPGGKIDESYARRAFAKQLGPRWRSPDHLPLHLQVLFAIFSMKANGQRDESDALLGEVAKYWDPEKGLRLPTKIRTQVKKVIRDPRLGMVTAKICRQHAFVTTAMLRILETARQQGGVLAPASFVWLRAMDRQMWYPFNNLGRAACHAEAAGAMSHYRAEVIANKPIPNPQVDTAIDGLKLYLKETEAPIPARDYGTKKS